MPKIASLRDEVESVLKEILSYEDPVEYFREKNIKGYRKRSYSCPVALALRMRTGKLFRVLGLTWSCELSGWGNARICGTIPKELENFIAAFDLGAYPDLVHPDLVLQD